MSHKTLTLTTRLQEVYRDQIAPALREQAGNPEGVVQKSDGSFVTEQDRLTEQILAEATRTAIPEAAFLGEETYSELVPDPHSAFTSPLLACVDPIDGTSSFVKGREDFFTSSYGLFEVQNEQLIPAFGTVLLPSEGEAGVLLQTFEDSVFQIDLDTMESKRLDAPDHPLPETIRFSSKRSGPIVVKEAHRHNARYDIKDVSVAELITVIRGENDVSVLGAKIWDIAGVIAIGSRLGLQCFRWPDGEVVESFSKDQFELDDPEELWRLNDRLIFCRADHASKILSMLKRSD